jgi:hypothetical protein
MGANEEVLGTGREKKGGRKRAGEKGREKKGGRKRAGEITSKPLRNFRTAPIASPSSCVRTRCVRHMLDLSPTRTELECSTLSQTHTLKKSCNSGGVFLRNSGLRRHAMVRGWAWGRGHRVVGRRRIPYSISAEYLRGQRERSRESDVEAKGRGGCVEH